MSREARKVMRLKMRLIFIASDAPFHRLHDTFHRLPRSFSDPRERSAPRARAFHRRIEDISLLNTARELRATRLAPGAITRWLIHVVARAYPRRKAAALMHQAAVIKRRRVARCNGSGSVTIIAL